MCRDHSEITYAKRIEKPPIKAITVSKSIHWTKKQEKLYAFVKDLFASEHTEKGCYSNLANYVITSEYVEHLLTKSFAHLFKPPVKPPCYVTRCHRVSGTGGFMFND
jgi:hypothetical protein